MFLLLTTWISSFWLPGFLVHLNNVPPFDYLDFLLLTTWISSAFEQCSSFWLPGFLVHLQCGKCKVSSLHTLIPGHSGSLTQVLVGFVGGSWVPEHTVLSWACVWGMEERGKLRKDHSVGLGLSQLFVLLQVSREDRLNEGGRYETPPFLFPCFSPVWNLQGIPQAKLWVIFLDETPSVITRLIIPSTVGFWGLSLS